MPTYNYRCTTCDTRFDVVQKMTDNTLKKCPKQDGPAECVSPGKGEVAKVFGAVGITFKGSGFYKNDSRGSSKTSGSSSGSSDTSSSDSSSSSSSDSSSGSSSSSSSSSSEKATSGASSSAD